MKKYRFSCNIKDCGHQFWMSEEMTFQFLLHNNNKKPRCPRCGKDKTGFIGSDEYLGIHDTNDTQKEELPFEKR